MTDQAQRTAVAKLQADIERYEYCVESAIGLVTSRVIRPSRGWAMATNHLQDKLAAARAKYESLLANRKTKR